STGSAEHGGTSDADRRELRTRLPAAQGNFGPGPDPMTLRVLIADDHPPTRMGVRMALEEAGMEIVAEVATGPAAVAAALEHRPDIALLDVQMPGSGITAARSISAGAPETAIVML